MDTSTFTQLLSSVCSWPLPIEARTLGSKILFGGGNKAIDLIGSVQSSKVEYIS